eukprot:2790767-Alexandrium_andersonii.AAC.1
MLATRAPRSKTWQRQPLASRWLISSNVVMSVTGTSLPCQTGDGRDARQATCNKSEKPDSVKCHPAPMLG